MAGRGRGRGRGLSINIEALGLGRGEVVPSVAQPPPLYPPLLFRGGLPANNAELDYMVALRQEMRYSLLKSPYYISAPNKVKDIERYSDKYAVSANDGAQRWEPDWKWFPTELQEKKKRKVKPYNIKPNLKAARKTKVAVPDVSVTDLLEKLEKVDENVEHTEEEQNEPEEVEDGIKREKKEDGEDEEDEEEYDEEDLEEETDYNLAYFDNGEGYGDEDEDDDEGPTY